MPTPSPDWESRPWGRPTVFAASSTTSTNLLGMAEFNLCGLRIRGVRICQNDNGTLSVIMPQKRFGDTIESVVFFRDQALREQFTRDVVWLFWNIFGRRMARREVTLRRFRLTGQEPSPSTVGLDLGYGWTTTQVMMAGANRAAVKSTDRTFTYADIIDEVRDLMADCHLAYPGQTSNTEKYHDDAQRVVDGRFGDLHRSGVFAEVA